MTAKPPFAIKRGYRTGCVRICVTLDARMLGENVAVQAGREVSAAKARDIAKALVLEAELAEAAVAKDAAAEARREAWRKSRARKL